MREGEGEREREGGREGRERGRERGSEEEREGERKRGRGLLTHTIHVESGIVAILYTALASNSNPACVLSSVELLHTSNNQVSIRLINVKKPAL